MSRTVGVAPGETNTTIEFGMHCMSLMKVLLTDVRINSVDRPIELLCHQSAGHPKCCMKPLQSLFDCLPASPLITHTSTSCSQARSHAFLICVFPYEFLRKNETALSLHYYFCTLLSIVDN